MPNEKTRLRPRACLDERQRYTIPEAAEYLRQSPSKTWIDIRVNNLKVIREGARTYVPGSEIVRRSRLDSSGTAA